jgi:hypothetical protein
MPRLPSHIVRALGENPRPKPDTERLARLAASIESAAAPILSTRRESHRLASLSVTGDAWWELPAAWAATLIPASLVLAAASILVLWRVHPPHAPRQLAEASVDQVVNEIVTTPPR